MKEKVTDYGALFVLLASFGVYLRTLTPTVGLHDSGELIACSYTLGIAHPPGYPLYTLFGKGWVTVIPIGNIAFRMNMQSALFASLASMMAYLIILKLSISNYQLTIIKIIPAIVASLIFAFSRTFWEQAVIAEKYTLNAFFFSLLIFILLKWQETQNSKLKTQNYLYLFAFLLGLSFCHHFQTIYIVPAAIFFVIATSIKKIKNQKSKIKNLNIRNPQSVICNLLNLLLMFLLFLLPLFLYIYIPLRASTHPSLNCNSPDTWERFWEYISVLDLRVIYLQPLALSLKDRFFPHLNLFVHEFGLCLILFTLLGFIFLLVKRPKFGIFLLLMAITNIFLAIRYDIVNIEDYYLPSFLLFSLLIGCFLFYLSSVACRLSSGLIPKTCLCLLFLLLPVLQAKAHYYSSDHSDHYIAYDYGRNLLKYTRDGAIIFLEGDVENIFPSWYLHYIERKKPNSAIIHLIILWKQQRLSDQPYANQIKQKYPDIDLTRFVYQGQDISVKEIRRISVVEIMENNPNKRPIYVVSFDKDLSDKYGYTLIPEGILWRVTKDNELIEGMDKERPKFDLRNAFRSLKRKDEEGVRSFIISNYFFLFRNRGVLYYQHNMYDKAIVEFKDALEIDPKNTDVREILGSLYFQKGMKDKAIQEFEIVLRIDPGNIRAKRILGQLKEEVQN